MRPGRLVLIGILPLALWTCARTAAAPDVLPPLDLAPCHLERLAEEVLCGTHEVFEDRDAGAGRRLTIHVAVMPALRRTAAPDPLFILAGGPGQGAGGFAPVAARYFRRIRRSRAIVLVDLRGTGESAPLTCPGGDDEVSAAFALDAAAVARCRDRLEADPSRFTHANALADLDEIRRRLGHPRINLWGGSWGTRAALLYAVTYPQAVRSVVLDGAVALSMEFPRTVAATAQEAFDRLLEACQADPACAAVHGGARSGFAALLSRLDTSGRQSPEWVATTRHPRTGAVTTVTLTREGVAEIVRAALYTPGDAARLLQVIQHAAQGDVAPLVAQALRSASISTDDMAVGATLSILCSEDLPLEAGVDFAREASPLFGAGYAEGWRRRCDAWPRGRGIAVDRDATAPVPALILSGAHDPVTPPSAGDAMARHFPNHVHIVVPGAAHNASFSGCVPDLLAAFVASGSTAGIDPRCASSVAWPPAVVSDAGTRP